MAQLANTSGVNQPYISKIAAGESIPSIEVLEKLLEKMSETDRTQLALEYVRLHCPSNAPNVRILINEEASTTDRLERAIADLAPATREALALLVEAVNRAPEQGNLALQAVGSWFRISAPGKVTPSADAPSSGSSASWKDLSAASAAAFESERQKGSSSAIPSTHPATEEKR